MAKTKQAALPPQPIDPEEIFRVAEECLRASELLIKVWMNRHVKPRSPGNWPKVIKLSRSDDEWYEQVPGIILGAFSVELYLKCLLTIEHGVAPEIHKVLKLFELLNVGSQARIKTIHRTMPGALKGTVEHLLGESSDAFVDFRYPYEIPMTGGSPVKWKSKTVGLAVRKLIIEMHPAWANPRSTQPTSPTH